MSMLLSALATVSKILAAMPGSSGTPTIVIFASLRSCATPVIITCSTVRSSIDPVTSVPELCEYEERTRIGSPDRRAYSTLRRCSTFAPQAASSNISSYVICLICLAFFTIRGSAVYTPSTSV